MGYYDNIDEVINIIKEVTRRADFSGLYDLISRLAPQYVYYYDPLRKYKKGELLHKNKEAPYAYEKLIFICIQDLPTDIEIQLDNIEYFIPIQNSNTVQYWYKNELVFKGKQRISIIDNQLYESTIYIECADKDPSETIDGKWIKIIGDDV